MDILMQSLKETELLHDYRELLIIKIDGKVVFRACDGEPEDNTLGRNFNDCWKIVDLMNKAYTAGLNGEKLNINAEKMLWEDI